MCSEIMGGGIEYRMRAVRLLDRLAEAKVSPRPALLYAAKYLAQQTDGEAWPRPSSRSGRNLATCSTRQAAALICSIAAAPTIKEAGRGYSVATGLLLMQRRPRGATGKEDIRPPGPDLVSVVAQLLNSAIASGSNLAALAADEGQVQIWSDGRAAWIEAGDEDLVFGTLTLLSPEPSPAISTIANVPMAALAIVAEAFRGEVGAAASPAPPKIPPPRGGGGASEMSSQGTEDAEKTKPAAVGPAPASRMVAGRSSASPRFNHGDYAVGFPNRQRANSPAAAENSSPKAGHVEMTPPQEKTWNSVLASRMPCAV